MCQGPWGPLCHDCTAELLPTWFWWHEVPPQYRLTFKRIEASFCPSARARKALGTSLHSGRCRAAVLWLADDRLWVPCGVMAASGHLCKMHQKAWDTEAYPTCVSQQFRPALQDMRRDQGLPMPKPATRDLLA